MCVCVCLCVCVIILNFLRREKRVGNFLRKYEYVHLVRMYQYVLPKNILYVIITSLKFVRAANKIIL